MTAEAGGIMGQYGVMLIAPEAAAAAAAAWRFSFRDANLLSAAEEAGCTHLISEDMQDGARLGGLEVVRAFEAGDVSARAREVLEL